MIRLYKILSFFLLFSQSVLSGQITESTKEIEIDYQKSTINTRIAAPSGYTWQKENAGSFGDFLTNFPLLPKDFPVRDYTKTPIPKQYNHVAILNVDVGEKDLQQCADAWIRLYAEYLWATKKFNEIEFQFTSGQSMSWNDFKSGVRTKESGDKVIFSKKAKPDDSYQNFRNYLRLVFQYAGTISLDRESVKIEKNEDIKVGDFLITPGSPGHSVFIVGIAKNKAGKKVYLLAESFMPAQDIHIIVNHLNQKLSPWYELNVNSAETVTARYRFKPTVVKRFRSLVGND